MTKKSKTPDVEPETKNELSVIPVEYSDPELQKLYDAVEKEVLAELYVTDTLEGRKRIRDVALKINQSKLVIDSPIRDHLKIMKAAPRVLEKSAKRSKEQYEALRTKILFPLVRGQERQDKLLKELLDIPTIVNNPDQNSESIQGWIDYAEKVDITKLWPELHKKFKSAIANALDSGSACLERISLAEKNAAELVALQKEKAEFEAKETARLAAEKAVKEAAEKTNKAEQDARDLAARQVVEAKQREEQAKIDLQLEKDKAVKLEAGREAKAKADKLAVETARLKAIEDAEKATKEAADKAEKEKEAAILLEQERIAEVEAEAVKAAEERAADTKHKSGIHRENLAVFVAAGIDTDVAKKVITMVAQNKLPSMKIIY